MMIISKFDAHNSFLVIGIVPHLNNQSKSERRRVRLSTSKFLPDQR